jgi:hypothetical protein
MLDSKNHKEHSTKKTLMPLASLKILMLIPNNSDEKMSRNFD